MNTELFENVIEYPNPAIKARYDQLVGLDHVKVHVQKEGRLLLNPQLLEEWSKKHYKKRIPLVDFFLEKPPLFIFAGDVGTGKTSLAETFGEIVSKDESLPITLYRLSLKTRGAGAVGEMTRLISSAFTSVIDEAKKFIKSGKKPSAALILLIDEADALAQSRELAEMNHEDRAGVNALIQGVDAITTSKLPILVVMCTNRINSIDPAVKRRAAAIFDFARPNDEQRTAILRQALADTEITEPQLQEIVASTGATKDRNYGYTYSDLTQKLLPNVVLNAFPNEAIRFESISTLLEEIIPTPPFKE